MENSTNHLPQRNQVIPCSLHFSGCSFISTRLINYLNYITLSWICYVPYPEKFRWCIFLYPFKISIRINFWSSNVRIFLGPSSYTPWNTRATSNFFDYWCMLVSPSIMWLPYLQRHLQCHNSQKFPCEKEMSTCNFVISVQNFCFNFCTICMCLKYAKI